MTKTRRRGRRAALLAALCGVSALLLGGCGACERPAGTPAPAAPPAGVETAGAAAPAPQGEPSLPEPGAVVVEVSERGVTALANAAPRREVLRRLGQAAGFVLVAGRHPGGVRTVTLRAVDLPLETVLSQVLEGLPYANGYEVDAETGAHVLRSVSIGDAETRIDRSAWNRPASRAMQRRWKRREKRERLADLPPEEVEKRREQRAARRSEREAQRRAEFAEAARELEDPDPQVRAAAVERIGGADEPGALDALLRALDDPDPRVVVAALEELMFVGDESIAGEVARLRDHPDPEVRQAAAEAADFLE